MKNNTLGLLYMFVGAIIAIVAAGDLLLRIVIALGGISLMYNGFQMRGGSPWWLYMSRWSNTNMWR